MTRGTKRSYVAAQSNGSEQNVKILKTGTKQEIRKRPLSLLDNCAKAVASKISFQEIEEKFARIPEPVQLRVIYWSFPNDEKEIRMYSTSGLHQEKMPYEYGLKLLEKRAVNNVLQVGFHLSGTVVDDDVTYKVSVNFDRCKITRVSCNCGNKDILWCSHVVALSLYRLRFPNAVTLRVPISETLLKMNRNQLQKLIQYLITAHHTEILPTAQHIADDIFLAKSEINLQEGAPDPTAGGAVEDDNRWHLDAEQVQEQVKTYLSQGTTVNRGKQLQCMFAKVRELLRVRDSNGTRMLSLITEQFLADTRLQQNAMTEKCRTLWDHLGSLWMCIALNPESDVRDKLCLKKELEMWSDLKVCPREDNDDKRSIFSRAIFACGLDWNNELLQRILKSNVDEQLSWSEDVCLSAARIDALKTHGFKKEALHLAVAVTNGMKVRQDEILRNTKVFSIVTSSGWIGNVLEPIPTLYDTLMEGSDGERRYVNLAVEVALIGLSQHRCMSKSTFSQQKSNNEEEQLIAQLMMLKHDESILKTIHEQASKILATTSSLGSGLCVDKNSVPLQIFARYLFNVLKDEDKELAFKLAFSALQCEFVLSETSSDWHIFEHLTAQQCELAAVMIKSCKNDVENLKKVLLLIKKYVHNPSYLFRLAQDTLRLKTDEDCDDVCEIVLDLALHILTTTINKPNVSKRRDVIHWLMAWSLQLDKSVIVTILQNWPSLFTTSEIINSVAPIVLSQCASQELKLTSSEKEFIYRYIRSLALQCITKDPQHCALSSLTLCESDYESFNTAYRMIVDRAGELSSTLLFAIARYMDHKDHPVKAFQLAALAIKHSTVGNNEQPCVGDVHWSCGLAHALGKTELTHMISLIVNAVQCPTVLSDLLHRCTLTPVGVAQINTGTPIKLTYSDQCLQPLIEAAINGFVSCVHNRLTQISPKHYTDFSHFLMKAKDVFLLAKDGEKRFEALIDNMKILYRGKRKLMTLLSQRLC
ncbi:zinc finger SWIM domain-containing protein 5-like [Xenia sp. Carnegie-2017]|uniref:zinc finger SWIM domain-containing protein 5-like n=1 Tax=Xenia sp. Carnegie-2017 TaxID=2897299 RepID=UPI001F042F7A|nr:zinc finger SWIM domain-containing protein 5-like [Xenia sp. Carnegie-2017]